MSHLVSAAIDRRGGPVNECAVLSEALLWSSHEATIWKPQRLEGQPHFYPVYRWGELYSYSLLSLILHKGSLHLNPRAAQQASAPGFVYQSLGRKGRETIDREIIRVGGPLKPGFEIREPREFVRQLGDAMREDVAVIEARNPACTNVLLCGGRDSLNLLFLPWNNPVIVASAPPNYTLVREFMDRNELRFDLVQIDDLDASLLETEILINACRNNLAHCRWGPDLVRLADSLGGKVVFWKGQLGDSLLQPKWRIYSNGPDRLRQLQQRAAGLLGGHGEIRLDRFFDRSTLRQRRYVRAQWTRGAMWQGAHTGFVRELTQALVVSGYHGPAARRVRGRVDLRYAVTEDIRPRLGEYLAARPLIYPASNPAPPLSAVRPGGAYLTQFLDALKRLGMAAR